MFITNRALSRRTILRGMGATLALPFLDAMVPVFRPAAAATPVRRFGAVFVPLGERPGFWDADDRGRNFELTAIMKPLEKFRSHMTVVSQLCDPLDGHADDGGGLAERRDPEADARRGRARRRHDRSGDRRPDRAGHADAVAGARDRGLHRLDRRLRPVVQLRLHEHHLVEERDDADADGDQPAQRVRADVRAARARARSARRGWRPTAACSTRCSRSSRGCSEGLGGQDLNRLNDYLENVREIEQRIQKAEKQSSTDVEVPDAPVGIPEEFEDHAALMYDLMALAYEANLTRVVTYHEVARRQPARLPEDRRHRAAPRDVAPRQQPREAREPGEAEHAPRGAVLEVRREAGVDAGRRRHAARSHGDPLRQRHERERHAQPHQHPDAARRQGRRDCSRATSTSRRRRKRRWRTSCSTWPTSSGPMRRRSASAPAASRCEA